MDNITMTEFRQKPKHYIKRAFSGEVILVRTRAPKKSPKSGTIYARLQKEEDVDLEEALCQNIDRSYSLGIESAQANRDPNCYNVRYYARRSRRGKQVEKYKFNVRRDFNNAILHEKTVAYINSKNEVVTLRAYTPPDQEESLEAVPE